MRIEASRELLAARPDVWAVLAEPYHLADWWPGISGVHPDRRGAAAGARWRVIGLDRPTLLRRPRAESTLVVRAADPPSLFAFHLSAERLDVTIRLEATAPDRTLATLAVEGPLLFGDRRALPRRAAQRLYDLCQTAASL